MPQPSFIYVGAPKAGSTWLYEALRAHPEVYVVPGKSTGWFERPDPGLIAGYVAQFAGAGPGQVPGEIAHDAWLYPSTAARLAADLPQITVLICLREPGAYATSILRWWATHTRQFGTSVEAMVAHPRFHAMTDFPGRLAPFYAALPREQICVTFQEDLKADAAAFFATVTGALGVSQTWRPPILDAVVNPAQPPRHPGLTRAVYAAGGVARRLGLGGLVQRVKGAPTVRRLLYAAPGSAAPAPVALDPAALAAAAEATRARLAPQYDALEAQIGRPLPAAWRTAPPTRPAAPPP